MDRIVYLYGKVVKNTLECVKFCSFMSRTREIFDHNGEAQILFFESLAPVSLELPDILDNASKPRQEIKQQK